MDDEQIRVKLEAVCDAPSFVAFLAALEASWNSSTAAELVAPTSPYGPAHLGWENCSIGGFLEAAVAGGADNRIGYDQPNLDAATAWRHAAEIVYCGKIYE